MEAKDKISLDEAITILKEDSDGVFIIMPNKHALAEKLGIEALKREKHRRKYDIHLPVELLPGETEREA